MRRTSALEHDEPACLWHGDPNDHGAALLDYAGNGRIEPHYQPIIDLHTGDTFAHELLSRFDPPYSDPASTFGLAAQCGVLWELESACQKAIIASLRTRHKDLPGCRFFVNVSPRVFMDDRFETEFPLLTVMAASGLDPRRVVIEITEATNISDYPRFERRVERCAELGYSIAIDDFGSGHSSLLTLLAASPRYLKLDRALVRDIHEDSYKQHLVKAVLSFVSNVESKLVAEGVEKREELEVLMRMGVRYAQGYLFGRPAPEPPPLADTTYLDLRNLTRRFHYPRFSVGTPISAMVLRPPVFDAATTRGEDLDAFFRETPKVDHVMVVAEGRPYGLIPRRHFYAIASGHFGFPLIQRRSIAEVCKTRPLTIREGIDLTVLGRLAMERDRDDVYDPVVVLDEEGDLVGTITMRDLLTHSTRLSVQLAANANPLTGLPGNAMIQQWMQEAVAAPPFSVIYGDLDNFKEYNDSYGFPQGDQMIKLAANTLADWAERVLGDANLGHVGGDDFVLVTRDVISTEPLRRVCETFDRRKGALFSTEDARNGFYTAVDRRGESIRVPLVTMSLAAVTSNSIGQNPFPGMVGQVAASVKKKVKALNADRGRSGYLIERRQYM